jgi:two-component system LytT family response regulator
VPIHAHPSCLILDRWAGDRRALRGLLAAEGWAVAGEVARWSEAHRLLREVRYSLVFLSEKLLGGDAWSLLPYLRQETRVVVTTRKPADPLRAFEVNALDYLVKPFQAERLANTLARLSSRSAPAPCLASPPTVSRSSASRRSRVARPELTESPAADPILSS